MKKVVLLGPPGSGKGTQSKFLVEKFGFIQISTGDLLRDQVQQKDSSMGKEISEIMKNGELVPDEIVIKLIIEKISIFKEENEDVISKFCDNRLDVKREKVKFPKNICHIKNQLVPSKNHDGLYYEILEKK